MMPELFWTFITHLGAYAAGCLSVTAYAMWLNRGACPKCNEPKAQILNYDKASGKMIVTCGRCSASYERTAADHVKRVKDSVDQVIEASRK